MQAIFYSLSIIQSFFNALDWSTHRKEELAGKGRLPPPLLKSLFWNRLLNTPPRTWNECRLHAHSTSQLKVNIELKQKPASASLKFRNINLVIIDVKSLKAIVCLDAFSVPPARALLSAEPSSNSMTSWERKAWLLGSVKNFSWTDCFAWTWRHNIHIMPCFPGKKWMQSSENKGISSIAPSHKNTHFGIKNTEIVFVLTSSLAI